MKTNFIRPIEAVIFDMDGLLLDSESLAMDALVTAAATHGFLMSREFCHFMIGAPADRCRALIVETYGSAFPLEPYFETHEQHIRMLVEAGKMKLKTGVLELMDALDAASTPRAIATSSSRARAENHLDQVDIRYRFDHIVTRDDVVCGKPHPEPFLKAAKLLNVAPQACLALEDSYNGIRAAHAAGMRVIMVPDLLVANDEMLDKAHRIFENLYDVIGFLDEVASQAERLRD